MPKLASLTALAVLVPSSVLALSCAQPSKGAETAPVATASASGSAVAPAAPQPPFAEISRADFNRVAVRENLPVYWKADADHDGAISAGEVAGLLFYEATAHWVESGKLTPEFEAAYARIVKAAAATKSAGGDDRSKLVSQELDAAMPTLVLTDLHGATDADKAFVRQMLVVASAVDALYAKQTGASAIAGEVAKEDAASSSLFRRNWGPRCVTPGLEKNDACRATSALVPRLTDVYPAAIQKDPQFCAAVEKRPNAKALLEPFVAVREEADKPGTLEAIGYEKVYAAEMSRVEAELRRAAALVTSPSEAPLRAYLDAAAKSFATNDWRASDEAWAKMNATNSKYYVRVAPDETYWEPCSHNAGFHLDFARINPDSLVWQHKLDPLKEEMEKAVAKLAGAPYKARSVSFHLPDFIDVVFNSGDSRNALGATIGQSLPNWGAVAREGRGRTVAMSNLYADPDNLRMKAEKANALFVSASAKDRGWDDRGPSLFATVLHEATHNLGPANEYKVDGKSDGAVFGGGLAAMLEELKAQTGALYYIEFLKSRGVIDAKLAADTYVDCLLWGLNHIARGMYTEGGQPKAYSQLAAIQTGFLMDEKAVVFDANATAANGVDKGAFDVKIELLPRAIEKLMAKVAGFKARGDRAGAEAFAKRYVDGDVVPHKVIQARVLRFPQVNFVYGVDL